MSGKADNVFAQLKWHAERNPSPEPNLEGQDAYQAWAVELPETIAWGETEESAKSAAQGHARKTLNALSPKLLNRVLNPLVQINFQATEEQKLHYHELAADEGTSLSNLIRSLLDERLSKTSKTESPKPEYAMAGK